MPTKAELRRIEELVSHYRANRDVVVRFLKVVLVALRESKALSKHCHSIKSRPKSYDSLHDKLVRKLDDAKEKRKPFAITKENLFQVVTDLAGVRILHIHTRQFAEINKALKDIIKEEKYKLVEKPFARTWDDESRAIFLSHGVRVEPSPSMYTSVHYILESDSRTKVTCEIQVRTLMEEVWGEVDHTFNYPHPSKIVACREQIKALARATSAVTRLVDSIFATADAEKKSQK
jgi:putative GTP pyrophosphokinase